MYGVSSYLSNLRCELIFSNFSERKRDCLSFEKEERSTGQCNELV